jgi:hypothetical protein
MKSARHLQVSANSEAPLVESRNFSRGLGENNSIQTSSSDSGSLVDGHTPLSRCVNPSEGGGLILGGCSWIGGNTTFRCGHTPFSRCVNPSEGGGLILGGCSWIGGNATFRCRIQAMKPFDCLGESRGKLVKDRTLGDVSSAIYTPIFACIYTCKRR